MGMAQPERQFYKCIRCGNVWKSHGTKPPRRCSMCRLVGKPLRVDMKTSLK